MVLSSLEVVEMPPPSPEVVEVSPPPPQERAKSQTGPAPPCQRVSTYVFEQKGNCVTVM